MVIVVSFKRCIRSSTAKVMMISVPRVLQEKIVVGKEYRITISEDEPKEEIAVLEEKSQQNDVLEESELPVAASST